MVKKKRPPKKPARRAPKKTRRTVRKDAVKVETWVQSVTEIKGLRLFTDGDLRKIKMEWDGIKYQIYQGIKRHSIEKIDEALVKALQKRLDEGHEKVVK